MDGDPAEPHRSSVSACSISSTASSARSSKRAARRTSPAGGLGLEGHPRRLRRALRRRSRSTSRGSHDLARARARALRAGAKRRSKTREKEMGTELLLRVFRHFYLEEIDRAVGRAPHEHGAPARRHRPPRLRPARSEAGVQEGGLRHLRHDDGGDELATSSRSCSSVKRPEGDRHRAPRARGLRARTRAQRSRCSSVTAARWPRARRRLRPPPRSPQPRVVAPAPVRARGAEDRPQRSLPVRQRREVQEVPRRRPRGRGQRG